jgi:hypothetical protein
MDTATLHEILRARQSHAGAWAFGASQDAVEPTCLAILALRHQPSAHLERALDTIENLQNKDGSWPAFIGDEPEGCWTTALAVLSLMAARHRTKRLASGIRWLLDARGRNKLVVAMETQHCRQQGQVRSSQVRLELGIRYNELGNPDCIRTHCLQQAGQRGYDKPPGSLGGSTSVPACSLDRIAQAADGIRVMESHLACQSRAS